MAQDPLHFAANPFLLKLWTGAESRYTGAKTGKALYAHIRSQMTDAFAAVKINGTDLSAILKGVSNRPFEIHHVVYKAICDRWATEYYNLTLTQRSEREKEFGPGQHELMHKVSSGNDKDKFTGLLSQVALAYQTFLTERPSHSLAVNSSALKAALR